MSSLDTIASESRSGNKIAPPEKNVCYFNKFSSGNISDETMSETNETLINTLNVNDTSSNYGPKEVETNQTRSSVISYVEKRVTPVQNTIDHQAHSSNGTKGVPTLKRSYSRTKNGRKKQETHLCNFCNRNLSSSKSLKAHINAIHTRELTFVCEICKRQFYSKGSLNVHKKNHYKEHQLEMKTVIHKYKCKEDTECKLSFKQLKELEHHKTKHTFKCAFCPAKCTGKKQLFNHNLKHTTFYPETCRTCKKTFTSPFGYKAHKCVYDSYKEFTNKEDSLNQFSNCNVTSDGHDQTSPPKLEIMDKMEENEGVNCSSDGEIKNSSIMGTIGDTSEENEVDECPPWLIIELDPECMNTRQYRNHSIDSLSDEEIVFDQLEMTNENMESIPYPSEENIPMEEQEIDKYVNEIGFLNSELKHRILSATEEEMRIIEQLLHTWYGNKEFMEKNIQNPSVSMKAIHAKFKYLGECGLNGPSTSSNPKENDHY